MTSTVNGRPAKVVDLAALAFYAGANGVECDEGLAQIEADHAKAAKQLEAERTPEIASLEARERTLLHLEPQAQERWAQMRERHKQDPPRVLVPFLMGGVGLAMALAEASLLAPALDMLRVTDPVLQLVLAIVISLTSSVLIHLALDARRRQTPTNWPLLSSATGALLVLLAFGIWRARALTFAATHSKSALGPFLADWPGLTTFVISSLTVMIPVAAAFAIDYALHHVWQWWEFTKARRAAKSLKATLDSVTKQVESARNTLAHDLDRIRHQKEAWQAQYRHYWQLGYENGAKKGPVWPVWVKSAAIAIAVMTCGLVLSLLGFRGAVLGGGIAGIAAGLAACAHFYHQWEHPTPEQFFRNADTRFTDSGPRRDLQVGTPSLAEPAYKELPFDPNRRELVRLAKGEA